MFIGWMMDASQGSFIRTIEERTGVRKAGRPALRFMDACKRDLKACEIDPNNWEDAACDRARWRRTVKEGIEKDVVKRRQNAEEKRARRKHNSTLPSSNFICAKCRTATRALPTQPQKTLQHHHELTRGRKLCLSRPRLPILHVWVFIAQLVEHCSANAEATGSVTITTAMVSSSFHLHFRSSNHFHSTNQQQYCLDPWNVPYTLYTAVSFSVIGLKRTQQDPKGGMGICKFAPFGAVRWKKIPCYPSTRSFLTKSYF